MFDFFSAVLPMATSTIKNSLTLENLKIVSSNDYPLVLAETANEDVKGIAVSDANGVIRYRLTFLHGGLQFKSYNASGTLIQDVHLVPEVGGN